MFSTLAEGTWPLGYYHHQGRKLRRWQKRTRKVSLFIVHHNAGTTDASLKGALVHTGRTLSCTYAMQKDGTIRGVVSEAFKPNTSASVADHAAVTIEIVNQQGAPGWDLSEVQLDRLARLLADVATRHGFPIDRQHVLGHGELRGIFGDSYATACPGPWMRSRMDELVVRARRYAGQPVKPTPAPAPVPAPSKPATPSIGRVRLGAQLRLIDWAAYDTSSLRGRQRANLTGTFSVVGISGGNFHVVGEGRDAWVHNSAQAGLWVPPAVKPTPKPAPAPAEPWRTPVGRTMRLAQARDAYRTAGAARARGPVWRRVPAGAYRITGASQGQFHIEGNGFDVWVSDGAKGGVQ